jgi:TM2 domain-containing membrane protein YozV
MANILQLMPTLEGDEMTYIQGLIKEMNDNQAQQFANIYNSRRKDPQTILLVTLLGFLGFAGVQRFMLDQIGMGLLFLFTLGFCFIGTIVDLVGYKKLAFEFNTRVAQQVAVMVRASN